MPPERLSKTVARLRRLGPHNKSLPIILTVGDAALAALLTVCMTDLDSVLSRLGLSQYLDKFVAEGFETWDTVLDITEEDL